MKIGTGGVWPLIAIPPAVANPPTHQLPAVQLFPPALEQPLHRIEPLSVEAESFAISDVKKSARALQNHNEVKLTGEYQKKSETFPTGTILVRTGQPLGLLVAYLLEPETEDGLVTWNFLDAAIAPGKTYPIYKLNGDFNAQSRPLQ